MGRKSAKESPVSCDGAFSSITASNKSSISHNSLTTPAAVGAPPAEQEPKRPDQIVDAWAAGMIEGE